MASATQDDLLFETLLRLGDDSLILGQRLGEWCGHAPSVEVDLSLANMGLDLIGQATHFLGRAGEVEGKGRDGDALAFHRDVLDFRNCLLVEQPNGDFAQTIARQFLFSNWQELLMQEIAAAPEPRLSAIGAKAVKEIAYHAKFASEWVVRLGDGTEKSRARMIAGLDWMWRFVDELFDARDGAPSHRAEWDVRIAHTLAEANLELPKPRRGAMGGRAGHHSEHLGHLLTEMQFLQRAYPGATW
jgi:ring-1,2-phenylacetyl-CoA epoxidase subunit PaaC